jgi:hypothetical protein
MRDHSETTEPDLFDDDLSPVVDDVTGLASRRGFVEMLRMEERRQARYGGSLTLMIVDVSRTVSRLPEADRPLVLVDIAATLADATRDTDTLGRIDEYRFGLLAIQAGTSSVSIVGRLRLFLEMRGVPADVTVADPGNLEQAWNEPAEAARPTLRLIR